MTEFFNGLVFLVSLTFQASVAIMFYLCGKRNTELSIYLRRYNYGVSKNILPLVKKLEKITGALYSYVVYGYIAFSLMNHKAYEECNMVKHGEGDTRLFFCGVYSTTWYPIYLDFPPVKHIFLVWQVLELAYYIPKVSTAMVIFYGSVALIEQRIDDLKDFLRDTKITNANANEVNSRLKFAVMKYEEISELVQVMNSTIGFIFSPVQHTILLGLLVFLEFRIILERNMESIPLLIFWSSFEFLMCWKGQALENSSLSLEREVYEFPWYDLDPSSRSIFKIFYGQVQLTLHMKSPPFIILNMQYYHEVMKGTYSFLMYLHRF
ncbi:uncharacterized protein LOC123682002 [Harmonia axyridis]|uniref:uncharacterized protein LOC123682002 n=1 Tax=Harmonia axyridis TaxID=115357 RepID=UPI001E274EE7|nr:uncharacterized protein LOC123682002 [Harmonia axyridis]